MSGPTLVTPQQTPHGPSGATYSDVYSNQLRVGATLHDVTLIFGATEDVGSGQVLNRDRATVRMSFSMAKILLLHLQTAIGSYESTVSEIRVPERLQEELANIRKNIESIFIEQMTGTVTLEIKQSK